jgi:serine protease Do
MMLRRISLRPALLVVVGLLAGAFFMNIYGTRMATSSVVAVVTPSKDRPITTLQDLNHAFSDIAKAVTPAVVTVSTEKTLKMQEMDPFADFFDSPFSNFFGNPHGGNNRGRQQAPEREFKQQGLGSGVIVSGDGYILTNNHVIENVDSISVRTYDGRTFLAKVVGADPKTDVAVIKVQATGLPTVKRGNSDSLQVGEMVMAIGSPLSPNLAHTVTQGIVSAKGRENVGLAEYEDFIQTDAAINPGNSGGALVNMDGELVGINSAIVSQSGGFQGIGLAVPINMALRVMDALIKSGKVVRGWLGVSIQDLNEGIVKAMHLPGQEGALIGGITPDSPAAKAGLKNGDVVVSLNNQKIGSSSELRNSIAATAPGSSIALGIMRDGKEMDFNVTLGELPSERAVTAMKKGLANILGFSVEALNHDLADKYQLDPQLAGVVVTQIDPHGNAYGAGLREGDLITSVSQATVANLAEFDAALQGAKEGDQVLFRVVRQDSGFYLAFTL